jgi:ribonuclease D
VTEQDIELTLITAPAEGLPEVVVTDAALRSTIDALRSGTGPVALDAERASGFRYSQRAYLIQLRREGSGTHLIDPTAFDDLSELNDALADVDWLLHAASQDLVCLAMAGLVPQRELYDTELAGRLLGLPRVALGTLTESILGISLAKEHSAADWSTRPLPDAWLNYAALDVEFLVPLWQAMEQMLVDAGKRDIAAQEFAHVRDHTSQVERQDPWRRTSGLHKVHKPRDLAIVREVWEERDRIAADMDVATGRLLPDAAIVAIALTGAVSKEDIAGLPEVKNRSARRYTHLWSSAIERAHALTIEQLPEARMKASGPPQPKSWAQRNPAAFARLEAVKSALNVIAEEQNIPVEHLMTPDVVRRVLWDHPANLEDLNAMLDTYFVRQWQRDLVIPVLVEQLNTEY